MLGHDVSVIAVTSDGKSFCYQLIAMLAGDKTILVISPLIALMMEEVWLPAVRQAQMTDMPGRCARTTSWALAQYSSALTPMKIWKY